VPPPVSHTPAHDYSLTNCSDKQKIKTTFDSLFPTHHIPTTDPGGSPSKLCSPFDFSQSLPLLLLRCHTHLFSPGIFSIGCSQILTVSLFHPYLQHPILNMVTRQNFLKHAYWTSDLPLEPLYQPMQKLRLVSKTSQ
jgi:hypothetical protein